MIGRVLDKYKILEEVGQGGMSVVYKGMDTSLNREVAVKVLHPHLASQDEARQRFQREAHAVAKLRHENILEIFDYSGRDSSDSYIVTEFINGRTLRGFMNDRAPAYPEIAAMIALEVCRALAHAHSLGVLHRDVKPENVMIRDDGVLKLMDFGIAQIVDSQRMTVTGQLLGSPAYMSPEHIEGRPLDFRTDVFSAGILLYQLATGELPFKGRNPHEILKRIAECRYLDARVVNPLVADRLNRIIAKALAREPDDRYPDVAPLVDDLGRFLAEVDLAEPRSELKSYFVSPVPYEQALRQRLIAALTRRGRAELEGRHTQHALELWNRVLTIDPANEEVLTLIDRLSHKRRVRWGIVVGLGLLSSAFAAASYGSWAANQPRPSPQTTALEQGLVPRLPERAAPAAAGDRPDPVSHEISSPLPADEMTTTTTTPEPERAEVQRPTRRPDPPRPQRSGGSTAGPAVRIFRLVPTRIKNATYSVDGSPFAQIESGAADVSVGPGAHKIIVRNELCDDYVLKIDAGDPGRQLIAPLAFKMTQVRVRCPQATAISVNRSPAVDGTAVDIPFSQSSRQNVEVQFLINGQTQTRSVPVVAGGPLTEVKCDGS